MKSFSKFGLALAAAGRSPPPTGGGAGKARRLVDQGLLQGRGRRALRGDQEVRAEDRRQGRAVAATRCRTSSRRPSPRSTPATPPDVAFGHVYDFQVTGKWAFEGRLEDISDIIGPMKQPLPPEHDRDDVPVERQDQEEGVLRVPAQAADDAHPVLEGHADGGRLQAVRHPDDVEGVLVVLVRQGAGRLPQEDRQAHLLDRLPDGRRLDRLVLLVPDLRRRVQRQARRRQRQAACSTIRRSAPA